jgi:hypothetical protein
MSKFGPEVAQNELPRRPHYRPPRARWNAAMVGCVDHLAERVATICKLAPHCRRCMPLRCLLSFSCLGNGRHSLSVYSSLAPIPSSLGAKAHTRPPWPWPGRAPRYHPPPYWPSSCRSRTPRRLPPKLPQPAQCSLSPRAAVADILTTVDHLCRHCTRSGRAWSSWARLWLVPGP